MANSRHYKWQANWTVWNGEALHVNGAEVSAAGALRLPPGLESALASKHGPHNTPRMLDRLAAEGRAVLRAHQQGIPQRHAKIVASSKS